MKPVVPQSLLTVLFATLSLAGCSSMPSMPSIPNPLAFASEPSTLHVTTQAKKDKDALPLLRSGHPIVLLMADTTDARGGDAGRKLGKIRTTVADMYGTEVVLDQDVAALVGSALKAQMAADGFHITRDAREAHDFELTQAIQKFRVDIGDRDESELAIEASLREVKSGVVIWAGVVTERNARFAGVMGNSKADIADFVGAELTDLTVKVSGTLRASLLKSYPQSIAPGADLSTGSFGPAGVTTTQAPVLREAAPAPAAVAASSAAAAATAVAAAEAAKATTGQLVLTTEPSRAKVYVGDVYYGLSPQTLDLDPGVAAVQVKLEGYKTATEKVSIRRGQTTELELKLQK